MEWSMVWRSAVTPGTGASGALIGPSTTTGPAGAGAAGPAWIPGLAGRSRLAACDAAMSTMDAPRIARGRKGRGRGRRRAVIAIGLQKVGWWSLELRVEMA